jgi:hypothetical protein
LCVNSPVRVDSILQPCEVGNLLVLLLDGRSMCRGRQQRAHPLLCILQALLLAGLRLEEVAVTREIMDALGAAEVKVGVVLPQRAWTAAPGPANMHGCMASH